MTWEDTGKQARQRLLDSIPSEWRLPEDKLPPADQANVLDVPEKSGLFSEHELSITTSPATHIVQEIASGKWKAVDVTRAFCKRAAVAHQLVCHTLGQFTSASLADFGSDKLPHCDYV
jgi:amidase